MTTYSYLYTFAITTVCLVILLGYLICFLVQRQRHSLLMAGLFAVYLLSELARNLAMLTLPGQPYVPSALVFLSCAGMELLYGLILGNQAKRPVAKAELVTLILMGTFVSVLSFTPSLSAYFDRLYYFIFIWGAFKLWPVRKRDRRTGVIFGLSVGFSVLHALAGLIDLLLPVDVFSFSSFFLTTFASELMFYVIIAASLVDLVFLFRALKQKPPATPEQAPSPVEAIAAQYGLSPRERDVLALIADGKSAKEIGEILFISEGTVKVHTHNISQKLNISGRRQVYQLMLEYQTGQRNG